MSDINPRKANLPAPECLPGRFSVAELFSAVRKGMWGGNGSGEPCDCCQVVIASTEVEYEVEAKIGGKPVSLRFHPRCYDVWRAGLVPGG